METLKKEVISLPEVKEILEKVKTEEIINSEMDL